ncbi:MAG: hypothetical protein ACFB10_09050 [Salibacteraceae bacterium]
MNLKKHLLFVLAWSAVVIGCQPDADEIPPVVIVDTPVENQSVQVPETLKVRAAISDEKALCQVAVTLLDANQIPVAAPISQSVEGSRFNLEVDYPITDLYLESGTYYLRISAFDGTNQGKALVALALGGVPKMLQEVVVVTQTGTNQLAVEGYQSGVGFRSIAQYSSDYAGSGVSSRHQYMAVTGNKTGSFKVLEYPTGNLLWEVPILNASFENFTNWGYFNDLSYVGLADGRVHGYNFLGELDFASAIEQSWIPESFLLHEGLFLLEQRAVNGTDRRISWYFDFSGAKERDSKPILFDVVELFGHNANEVLLFCNENGEGVIKTLFQSTSGISNARTLPNGTIQAVLQIKTDVYLIAHSTGVYEYRYGSSTGLLSIIGGKNAQVLGYDSLGERLFLGIGNQLEEYFYVPGSGFASTLGTTLTGGTVLGVHPIYNK